MANPIKRFRALLGVALLAGGAYVTWMLMKADISPAVEIETVEAQPPPSADGQPGEAPAVPANTTCLEGFRGERFESMRGLSAGLACVQDDDSWLLEQGVEFRLAGEAGRPPITVTSSSGVLPADADGGRPLLLSGDVLVVDEDGFRLETQELELFQAAQLVKSKTPVVFSRQAARGSAGRMEHDWGAKETVLAGGATVVLAGEQVGDQPITVKGMRMRLYEERGLIEVRQRATIDLDGGRVSGERIDATMSADGKSVERVESSGGAETLAAGTGFGLEGGSLATRRLRAGRIVHLLGPGNQLRSIEAESSVVLSGQALGAAGRASTELLQGDWALMSFAGREQARLESIEARGAPARLLSEAGRDRREAIGSTVLLGLRPDGSLERLAAKEDASLLLRGAEGERSIRGDEVEVGLSGESLETLRFAGRPAELVETVAGPTGPQERGLTAARGDLRFGPDGSPVEGSLEGQVEMLSGPYRAKGRSARIANEGNSLTLEGEAALVGPGRESHGDRVEYDRATGMVAVVGDQHTILTESAEGSSLGDFVSGDEPVLISAERMDVELATRRVVYSAPTGGGRPDVRQGDVALRGDTITLDEGSGDLVAEGAVETKLRLAKPDGAARPPDQGLFDPRALIAGTCQTFRYQQAKQLVVYDGDVRLEQGKMALSAEEVEVGLKTGGSEVEYLKARRRSFYEGTGFQAEGDLIDYRQAENLVRVEGGRRPARAVRDGGDLATGGVLELQLDQDGILITAPHGGRTRGSSSLKKNPSELEQ